MGPRWGWEVKKGACHHREFIRPDEGAHPTGTFPPRYVYESLVGKIAEQSGALKVKWLIPFLYKESRNMVSVTDWVSGSWDSTSVPETWYIYWYIYLFTGFSSTLPFLWETESKLVLVQRNISLELTSLKGELCEKSWDEGKSAHPPSFLKKEETKGLVIWAQNFVSPWRADSKLTKRIGRADILLKQQGRKN